MPEPDPLDKARALRLSRLSSTLAERLVNADSALEVLVAEAAIGDPQADLWKALHSAGRRDREGQALAAAYQRLANGRRFEQLEARTQAEILMHAADFFDAIGDSAATETALERVQQTVPGHRESFMRLERRLEGRPDRRRLLELYSLAAIAEPRGATALASKATSGIVPLAASSPLGDDACERLVVLAAASPRLLEALEEHCRKTRRFTLACKLVEIALEDPDLPEAAATQARRRLVEHYVGDAQAPAGDDRPRRAAGRARSCGRAGTEGGAASPCDPRGRRPRCDGPPGRAAEHDAVAARIPAHAEMNADRCR